MSNARMPNSCSTVAAVERSARIGVTVAGASGRYSTELVGFEPATRMHGFGVADAPTQGLVAGRSLAGLLGVDVGDEVTVIATGSGGPTVPVTLPVEAFVDEPLGTFAYGPLDVVTSLGGEAARETLLVGFDGTASSEQMRSALTSTPGVVAYVDSRALYDTAQGMMSLFRAFVGVMLGFGAIMSFALIVGTTSANAAERAVELAALRVNGASHAELGRLLGAENLILTLLSIGPGLVVGWAVSALFMDTFSSDLFDFSLHVRATTLLFSALAIVAVSVLAQWPAIRVLAGLDVARVVRERVG